MNEPDDVVSASEIAAFEWCPESWRLEKGLRLTPGNSSSLAAGERHHEEKAAFEKRSGSAISAGTWLLLFGVLLAALAAFLLWVS